MKKQYSFGRQEPVQQLERSRSKRKVEIELSSKQRKASISKQDKKHRDSPREVKLERSEELGNNHSSVQPTPQSAASSPQPFIQNINNKNITQITNNHTFNNPNQTVNNIFINTVQFVTNPQAPKLSTSPDTLNKSSMKQQDLSSSQSNQPLQDSG